eukprot:gene8479-17475_t
MSDMAENSADGNYTIETYIRILPTSKAGNNISQDPQDTRMLHFDLPEQNTDFINNVKFHHEFLFDGIFPMSALQDDVFDEVGTAAVQTFLDGKNSTIFAYGETGSGKTYTMVGGSRNYSERGLIPRAISKIFEKFRSMPDVEYKTYISFLELYNEQGYDLLVASQNKKICASMDDLQKVNIMEDENGNIQMRNLSLHVAETEQDALNLLILGTTNRMIAETPINEASSRSHCLFTINLEAHPIGTKIVRTSKIHLVDLAGFERIARKTNPAGSVLLEAKFINSSLFFLEMVIAALNDNSRKQRRHIPYRNSLLTSVLRDSLGGNCKTIMIATLNPDPYHTEESLSTLRFAQSVSWIRKSANDLQRKRSNSSPRTRGGNANNAFEPIIIQTLKDEIKNLKEEVSQLSMYKKMYEDLKKTQIKTPADSIIIKTPLKSQDLKSKQSETVISSSSSSSVTTTTKATVEKDRNFMLKILPFSSMLVLLIAIFFFYSKSD